MSDRRYVGMRCGPPFCGADCQCRFDRAWEASHARLQYNVNVFHYSSYWGTWSRVLTPYSGNWVLELNLTPVNPSYDRSWEETVRPIIFREHLTALNRQDELTESLPNYTRAHMAERIGEELTTRLLTTDWLPLLNRRRVREGKYGGGGLPFVECCR